MHGVRGVWSLFLCLACAERPPALVATPGTASATSAAPAVSYTEADPEYWLERLGAPDSRETALERLVSAYDAAWKGAGGASDAERLRELVGKTVLPLTRWYVHSPELPPKLRSTALELLSRYRDARAEPAFRAALERFAAAPSGTREAGDIRWAAKAVADLELRSLSGPLLDAFFALRPSAAGGSVAEPEFRRAVPAIASRSWVHRLVAALEVEVPPSSGAASKDPASADQSFWQQVSAHALGHTNDPAAIRALLRVALDPEKVEIHDAARMSLLRFGKAGSDAALAVLEGRDSPTRAECVRDEMAPPSPKRPCRNAPAGLVGLILWGNLGCKKAEQPLAEWAAQACDEAARRVVTQIAHPSTFSRVVAALQTEKEPMTRGFLTFGLLDFPAGPEPVEAFQESFETLSRAPASVSQELMLGVLAAEASEFFDATLVEWLLERAKHARGSAKQRANLRHELLLGALRLARPDQMTAVRAAVAKYGGADENRELPIAEGVLDECGERAECYVDLLAKTGSQPSEAAVAVKAAHMAGVFGNEQTRDALLARRFEIRHSDARRQLGRLLQRLSPRGSTEAMDRLLLELEKQARDAAAEKAKDDTAALRQALLRLRARKQ